MNEGILTLPVLPVRCEPSERAEMTTQLLFGEQFECLDTHEGWLRIRNASDGYEGWVTSKMTTMLSASLLNQIKGLPTLVLREPLTQFRTVDAGDFYLPAGSRLFLQGSRFFFPSAEHMTELFLEGELPKRPNSLSLPECILDTAMKFLNAPYLWGGKTVLGMDCSGLTQLAAAINGFQLPRDAKDQALLGEDEFLSLSLPGDLAFFANPEGRIVHVGIVAGSNRIVHASGSVRIDILDEHGIFNQELRKYSHRLFAIKRIFRS